MRADCYHALTRGNGRVTVFHDEGDYAAFIELIDRAIKRHPIQLFAYCLMPNHVHFVLHADPPRSMSQWMHWLLTTHAARYRMKYGGSGHIWQGRFKTFPIQQDAHLLRVMRYVERNPLTASLVQRAEAWRWSSLVERDCGAPARVALPPLTLPADWSDFVNAAIDERELERIRHSTWKGTPFGSAAWIEQTVRELGLESTVRPRGRPRKIQVLFGADE